MGDHCSICCSCCTAAASASATIAAAAPTWVPVTHTPALCVWACPPFPPSVCPHAHLHLSMPAHAFICACSCSFMPIQLHACFCWSPLPGRTCLAFVHAHLGSFVLVPTTWSHSLSLCSCLFGLVCLNQIHN